MLCNHGCDLGGIERACVAEDKGFAGNEASDEYRKTAHMGGGHAQEPAIVVMPTHDLGAALGRVEKGLPAELYELGLTAVASRGVQIGKWIGFVDDGQCRGCA